MSSSIVRNGQKMHRRCENKSQHRVIRSLTSSVCIVGRFDVDAVFILRRFGVGNELALCSRLANMNGVDVTGGKWFGLKALRLDRLSLLFTLLFPLLLPLPFPA